MSRAPQWPRIGSRKEPLRGTIGEARCPKSWQLLRFLGTSAPLPHGIGASCVLRPDLEGRADIGLEKIMWGSDFPHPEGSWPNTAQYFKDNFSHFPEADGRKILGENAVKFYGLDRQRLQAVADQIGPTAALFN